MIKKIIISTLIFVNFSFAGIIPYCSFTNITSLEIVSFTAFLNNKSQSVIKEINTIPPKQELLLNTLNLKIEKLTQIKKILSAILILKKQENFNLNKKIKLMLYEK